MSDAPDTPETPKEARAAEAAAIRRRWISLGEMLAVLAVGISGIQQLGGSFWVEPLFNGVTLLIAIGIAGYAQRRRAAAGRATLLEKPRPASADLITERGNT